MSYFEQLVLLMLAELQLLIHEHLLLNLFIDVNLSVFPFYCRLIFFIFFFITLVFVMTLCSKGKGSFYPSFSFSSASQTNIQQGLYVQTLLEIKLQNDALMISIDFSCACPEKPIMIVYNIYYITFICTLKVYIVHISHSNSF